MTSTLDPVEVTVLAVDVLVTETEHRVVTLSSGENRACDVATGRHVPDPQLLLAAVTPQVQAMGLVVDGAPVVLTADVETQAWLAVQVPVAAPAEGG
jgi:hypothetical protein